MEDPVAMGFLVVVELSLGPDSFHICFVFLNSTVILNLSGILFGANMILFGFEVATSG